MPRKKYVATDRYPYHITNRSNNREWFDVPMDQVWSIFCEQIAESAVLFSVSIHSLVLMSNHFHLMASTPNSNLDRFLRHLLTELSRAIKRRSNRINHIFGGRSQQSILDSAYAVAYVYKYIYRNPVRAGLCHKAEDYTYSSLRECLVGKTSLPLTEGFDSLWSDIPKHTGDRLEWLNMPTHKESEQLITKALRRGHFRFSKSNSSRAKFASLRENYGISHPDDPYLLGPKGE